MPKIERYAKAPEISGGYFLEGDGDKGWFSVLVPLALTSINTNPSFETDLTGATAANSALVRTSNYQRRGVYSMQVTPSSTAAAGAYWTITTTTDGQYSCGLDLYDPAGRWFDLYFADSSGNRISRVASVRGANYWKRLWVNFAEYSGGTRRVVLARRSGGNTQPFYVDGVNILPTQYRVAYFDGDKKGFLAGKTPFYWNGTPHASTYTQVFDTGNGGREVKLLDLGFRVLAVIGLGMMQFKGISTPISEGGAQYQRSVPTERSFALVGQIADVGLNGLQRVRAALEEVLNPMRTDTMQPMVLRYHRTDPVSGEETECLDIPCVFETAGLAGALSNKNAENIELPFKQYLPQIYVDGEQGSSFSPQTIVSDFANVGYRDTDGTWKIMGAGLPAPVRAMAVSIENTVYITGDFTTAGGDADNAYITMWDGSTYNPLATGLQAGGLALIVGPDNALYAGGFFSHASGVANTGFIAKWDGAAWSALGTGMNDDVLCLAMGPDGALYAGGRFTLAGGVANTVYIAKWDGSVWTPLGTGMNAVVRSLAIGPDGALYAAGDFTLAGGVAANRIAKWDGAVWTSLGSGLDASASSLAIGPDGTLYVGGSFTSAGGLAASRLAKWNGTAWADIGGADATVNALVFSPDGTLYVGGNFTVVGGLTLLDHGAMYKDGLWLPMDINVQDYSGYYLAFAFDRIGRLYMGGYWVGSDALASSVTTIDVEGTTGAYPVIEFTGPGTVWLLQNRTNGKIIYFKDLTLSAGEVATLDTTPMNFSFTSSFRGDLQRYIQAGSTEFYVSQGENNISALMTETDANSAISAWWTPEYLSIDAAAR